MLLICTDASRRDLRALDDCTMDMEFGDGGGDANTFELRMPVASAPEGLTFGSLVYVDGTEYGGIVDDVGSDTTGRIHKAVYGGRTWHGVLEGRVLRPDRGADYLSVSGEANAVLLQLVHRMGLAGLFAVDASDSGIRVGYRFARYVAGYAGLRAMLASAGAKLAMRWDGGKVVLSAMPRRDWSREEFEGRRTPIKIKQASRPVNHLVCLGKGELAQRTVIDLYADESGNVSKTQSMFGVDEVERAYDYSSAEDADLEQEGIKRLKELQHLRRAGAAAERGLRRRRRRGRAREPSRGLRDGDHSAQGRDHRQARGDVLVRGGRRVLSPGDNGALMAAR